MRTAISLLAVAAIIPIGCIGSPTAQSERDDAVASPTESADTNSADDPIMEQDVRAEAQETLETAEELNEKELLSFRSRFDVPLAYSPRGTERRIRL